MQKIFVLIKKNGSRNKVLRNRLRLLMTLHMKFHIKRHDVKKFTSKIDQVVSVYLQRDI